MVNIIKWKKKTIPVASTGRHTLTDLPRIAGERYQRLHGFEAQAGDIKSVEVEIESLRAQELTRTQNEARLLTRNFNPQNDVYSIIFDDTQRVTDGYPVTKADGTLVSEFRIDFEMENASPFTLLYEVLGDRD